MRRSSVFLRDQPASILRGRVSTVSRILGHSSLVRRVIFPKSIRVGLGGVGFELGLGLWLRLGLGLSLGLGLASNLCFCTTTTFRTNDPSDKWPLRQVTCNRYMMRAHSIKNNNQVVHGDQTRCEGNFMQGWPRMLKRDFIVLYCYMFDGLIC